MATKRIRYPVYDELGRIRGAVNADVSYGPANATTGRRASSNAATIGHMNPGAAAMRGVIRYSVAAMTPNAKKKDTPK